MANIPEGVICGWPGTEASIPAGWNRVTTLDGRYVRGIPDAETEPGSTGGAASHGHTTPGHTHDLSHAHGSANSTGATNPQNTTLSGASAAARWHAHDFTLDSENIDSGSSSPGTDAVDNDPAHLEVIWIESDGTPGKFPAGALLFCAETEVPSGYVLYTDGDGLFLKGAPALADGGTDYPSSLDAHQHTVDSHVHGGTSHSHPNTTSGGPTGSHAKPGGGTSDSTDTHTHSVSSNSVSTGDTGSAGATSGEQSAEPPYIDLLVIESEDSTPKIGTIAIWLRPLEDIPGGWALCDGESGTPDLCNSLFVRGTDTAGNIGNTGGSETHSHTGGVHSHSIGSHTHSATFASSGGDTARGTGFPDGGTIGAHGSVHNATSAAATPTVGSASTGTLSTESHVPEYTEVAYIILVTTSTEIDVTPAALSFTAQDSTIAFVVAPETGAYSFLGQEPAIKITKFIYIEPGVFSFVPAPGLGMGFIKPWLVRLTPEPFSEVLLRVRIRGE